MSGPAVVARHAGGMRFDVTSASGHVLTVDDGVGDAGPRPTEALLGSLATCTAMDVASILAKKRQAFTAYVVEVRGEQRTDFPRVFTWIELTHVVEGRRIDETAVRRSIELSATRYCPVNAMVSAGPTRVHHRYRIVDPEETPSGDRSGEVVVTGPFAPVPAPAP